MKRSLTLAAFLCGGLALVGVRQLVATPARVPLTVRVGPTLDDAARERAIDEAVLVEVGLTLAWKQDPLIRDRLVRTLTPILGAHDDLFARAEAIDLPRRDPLIRARLVERARKTLPEPGTPSDAELAAFLAAHAALFTQPAMLTFEHRFAPTNAPERFAQMQQDATDAGLPELTLGLRPTRSSRDLERTLGAAAAQAIATAPVNVWTAIDSPLGHHLVRLVDHTLPYVPALATIRAQVVAAWRAARRPDLEREALARLRAGFELQLEASAAMAWVDVPRSAEQARPQQGPGSGDWR